MAQPRGNSPAGEPPVIVTDLRGAFGRSLSGRQWVYLGKGTRGPLCLTQRFGAERRLRLGTRFHTAAAKLRRPFLDTVAEFGRVQTDPVGWWSSLLSWKVWAIADLFPHICYLQVAQQLIQGAVNGGPPIVVVVENPWVLKQLSISCADLPGVRCTRTAPLGWYKLLMLCRGLHARALWCVRIGVQAIRQRAAWSGTTAPPESQDPVAAIYSYPQPRCFRGEFGWTDPFLPGVAECLSQLGYRVIRFTPPQAAGFERDVAKRRAYMEPLVLHATVKGLWRALSTLWLPRWPEHLSVDGLSIRILVEGEWWRQLGQSSACTYRLFYESLRQRLAKRRWSLIVYPYENQPWEKLLALCAREHGVRTVGIQHSTLSVNYMSCFLGEGEADRMPLPDVICAAGPYPFALLREWGTPPERLRLSGSLRYAHLAQRGRETLSLPPASPAEVLLAVPVDVFAAHDLLAAVRAAFPDGGASEGVRFHVRIHPSNFDVTMADLGFPAAASPPEFSEALARCGLVLYTGSSIGVEAAAMGRPVLRYRPERLLDLDPSEPYGEAFPVCTEETLREALLALIGQVRRNTWQPPQYDPQRVFAPVDWGVLQEAFGWTPAREDAPVPVAVSA